MKELVEKHGIFDAYEAMMEMAQWAELRAIKRCKNEVRDVEQQYEHECYTDQSREGFNGCIGHIEWAINEWEKELSEKKEL